MSALRTELEAGARVGSKLTKAMNSFLIYIVWLFCETILKMLLCRIRQAKLCRIRHFCPPPQINIRSIIFAIRLNTRT